MEGLHCRGRGRKRGWKLVVEIERAGGQYPSEGISFGVAIARTGVSIPSSFAVRIW